MLIKDSLLNKSKLISGGNLKYPNKQIINLSLNLRKLNATCYQIVFTPDVS
jgi:hypothetical protein